jgi:hypothetical protein
LHDHADPTLSFPPDFHGSPTWEIRGKSKLPLLRAPFAVQTLKCFASLREHDGNKIEMILYEKNKPTT